MLPVTFQLRIVGLIPVVNKGGTGITNDETVTLMNDIVVMAPAAILDLPCTFETLSERSFAGDLSQRGVHRVRDAFVR